MSDLLPHGSADTPSPEKLLVSALVFQGGLALLGILAGWLFGFHDRSQSLIDIEWESVLRPALVWGILGTIPMLGYLALAHYCPIGPIKHVRKVVDEKLAPLLKGSTLLQMIFLSLLAGVTEEILFRWCLQGGLTEIIPIRSSWIVGLLVASIVFGAMHCINLSYALITTMVGLYLGGLMLWSGTWLAPAIAHALFDFVALFYITRVMPSINTPNGA